MAQSAIAKGQHLSIVNILSTQKMCGPNAISHSCKDKENKWSSAVDCII